MGGEKGMNENMGEMKLTVLKVVEAACWVCGDLLCCSFYFCICLEVSIIETIID